VKNRRKFDLKRSRGIIARFKEEKLLNRFIPIDKSSAIRAFLFSLMTEKEVFIVSSGELPLDAVSALESLKLFGKKVSKDGDLFRISGKSEKPCMAIDCGNSATVMHILMGIRNYLGFDFELIGDESLMSRSHRDFYDAQKLYGGGFVETALTKESAQLKSFHLISMLKSGGKLSFKYRTRRNTEELLRKMGAKLLERGNTITVFPADSLDGFSVTLKKDPSSALIAVCTALIFQKSFEFSDIYLDGTRILPFTLLQNAGFNINLSEENGSFTVSGTPELTGEGENIEIGKEQVPAVIDEIPFLALMAACAGRHFSVKNAGWLRNKESDRIKESVKRLSLLFETEESEYGFEVGARKKTCSPLLFPHSSDHRMEMLSCLMSEYCGQTFESNGSYKISFPLFYEMTEFLRKDGK